MIPYILDKYNKWSKYIPEEGVVIAYASMYGNTQEYRKCPGIKLSKKGLRI